MNDGLQDTSYEKTKCDTELRNNEVKRWRYDEARKKYWNKFAGGRETGTDEMIWMELRTGRTMKNATYRHGMSGREYVHGMGGKLTPGMSPTGTIEQRK